jgi:hypothetical protein
MGSGTNPCAIAYPSNGICCGDLPLDIQGHSTYTFPPTKGVLIIKEEETRVDWLHFVAAASVAIAAAKILDVLFVYKQRALYDRFVNWWYWIAEAKPQELIRREIDISVTLANKLFGEKLWSWRSILSSGLLCVILPFPLVFFLFYFLSILFFGFSAEAMILGLIIAKDWLILLFAPFFVKMLPAIILPGVVSVGITRFLLNRARRSHNFWYISGYIIVDLVIALGLWIFFSLIVLKWFVF